LAKLKALSGAEVCTILEKHGFLEKRRKGNHIVMQKRTAEGTCTVPVPDHKELKTGTLASIIRQSSIPRSEFE
jgi:predicted RNA binding protein YcfA (HicA-like mRNA interferase family)